MKPTYRLECKWPHSSWSYVPEHSNLTLKRARELIVKDRHFEREGMKQRIVKTTQKVIHLSKSRPYPAEYLAGLRNIRGY